MSPEPREIWPLDTRHLGRQVFVFDELDSTNALALSEPMPAPFSIIARHQTAGRGRFGRVWRSRPDAAVLLSVAFTPPPALRRPSVLTAWAAVAVADAVEKLSGLKARIKWPNDLLVQGRKICGILIEQRSATVVGIGLNLNQSAEEFEAAGLPLAASLASLTGSAVDWRSAAEAVLRSLDEQFERLCVDRQSVEAAWRNGTGLDGHVVEVERTNGSRLQGRLLRLTFDELELECEDGTRLKLIPESVEHVSLRPT